MEEDIRWKQRFTNFLKALDKLDQSVRYFRQDGDRKNEPLETLHKGSVLNEMLKEGLIQRFEYTHELAWNVMKDYAEYQGNSMVGGSRDATREAFKLQLIANGKVWMDMIISRNKSSHTYNVETADEIYEKILDVYYQAFIDFRKTMEEKRSGKQENLFE